MAKKLTPQERAVAHHLIDSKMITAEYVKVRCACGADIVAHAHEHMTEDGSLPNRNVLEAIADRLHEKHKCECLTS